MAIALDRPLMLCRLVEEVAEGLRQQFPERIEEPCVGCGRMVVHMPPIDPTAQPACNECGNACPQTRNAIHVMAVRPDFIRRMEAYQRRQRMN